MLPHHQLSDRGRLAHGVEHLVDANGAVLGEHAARASEHLCAMETSNRPNPQVLADSDIRKFPYENGHKRLQVGKPVGFAV